jgi:hypothetical protein
MLPAMITTNATESEPRIEAVHSPNVPQQWMVAIRLALVAFVTTSWFLSRSYTTTMYLVLGLATAAVALQRNESESHNRGHWVLSTLVLEVMIIALIYCLVRLRH